MGYCKTVKNKCFEVNDCDMYADVTKKIYTFKSVDELKQTLDGGMTIGVEDGVYFKCENCDEGKN